MVLSASSTGVGPSPFTTPCHSFSGPEPGPVFETCQPLVALPVASLVVGGAGAGSRQGVRAGSLGLAVLGGVAAGEPCRPGALIFRSRSSAPSAVTADVLLRSFGFLVCF